MRSIFSTLALMICVFSIDSVTTSTNDKPIVASTSPASTPSAPPSLGKVLFVGVVGSRSHKNFYYGIIEALSRAGYEVTLLTPYHPAKKMKNVREIVLESNDMAPYMVNLFDDGKMNPKLASSMMTLAPELCLKALGSDLYSDVLKEKFDIAFVSLFFNDCFLGPISLWHIPFVLVTPSEMVGPFAGHRFGNPTFPSIDDNPMFPYPKPLSFLHRMAVVSSEVVMAGLFKYMNYRSDLEARSRGLFASDTPAISSILPNASLMIANSFRLAEHPRPYMPNVLLAGGIHLKPPGPLPKDLEDWVQSSGDDGFIFFSLGSAVRASDIPSQTIDVLLSVFKSLKQKVLWKFDLPDVGAELPPNVRLTTWAPQQDLLGHPKMRLFITHGGLLSTQEATYHGVPVIGIPVFGDQVGNMQKAETQGWGLKLEWDELTYDRLMAAILSLTEDFKARQKVGDLGVLMRDRPTNPADDVVWWTGYILRTSGAHHLKSGALYLTWYELYNIDVWAVVVLVLLILLWVDYLLLRALYRRCCRPAAQASKKHKQH